jgi:hypothetical protein
MKSPLSIINLPITATAALAAMMLHPATALATPLDRHTLSEEASRFPNLVRIIVGRIERNPPIYYEVRLNRLVGDLRSFPNDLRKYDEAAGACDRIGRYGDAIRYMEQKRALLEKVNSAIPEIRAHWLGYYANLGGFLIHRWIRSGSDRTRIADLRRARDVLSQVARADSDERSALKCQLVLLDWLIDPRVEDKSKTQTLPEYLRGLDSELRVVGLARLVILSEVWENVDVMAALADALDANGQGVLSYVAKLRCVEMIDKGGTSVLSGALTGPMVHKQLDTAALLPADRKEVEEQYRSLRKEAVAFRRTRDAYVLEGIKSGRDPDNDLLFWRNFNNTPPPKLNLPWPKYVEHKLRGETLLVSVIIGAAAILLFVCSLAIVQAVRTMRKRMKELLTPPAERGQKEIF